MSHELNMLPSVLNTVCSKNMKRLGLLTLAFSLTLIPTFNRNFIPNPNPKVAKSSVLKSDGGIAHESQFSLGFCIDWGQVWSPSL